MSNKILGLDLGTNSIGWAIRDIDSNYENQIVDYGVIVFEKGVGEGKSGEFSLAAERRKNRSKRRLYNAKRYRKWELLKLLINNQMCPLSNDELRLWSIGDWVDENGKMKNKGRKYPSSPDFIRWLAMDFEKIGQPYVENEKLKPEFRNPYELRNFLLENNNDGSQKRKYQIGRALYHFAQRRGFKTSRKSGKSTYAENKEIENKKTENPNYQIANYALEKLNNNHRFRASGVIQRKYYEEEFISICQKQGLDETLTQQLFNAVYYVRPLRSQKGLVGKCTLEKGKARIPVSHPLFEEFRALTFINNIQWRETNSNKPFEPIPIELKKSIFEQLVFRKIEKGKDKGKVSEESFFKFEEIVRKFSENYKFEFNYAKYNEKKLKEENKYELISNPNVPACPVIASLMNVFDEEWKEKFITNNNRFGIHWDGLTLEYTVQYGNSKGQKRKLNYEGIWHLLFDYLQTKDDAEGLKNFCKEVLQWDETKAEQFSKINIEQGYGSLSRKAISKIIPYLQEGYIYSEAVSFANLSEVLGKETFDAQKDDIKKAIADTIHQIDREKEKLNIVNGLIKNYFGEQNTIKAKGLDETIKEIAKDEVERKLKNYFGETNWQSKTENFKKEYFDFVLEKYLTFLDGKQKPEEKASYRLGKSPQIDYYKLPRLDEAIKKTLKEKFGATDARLKRLYHPSDIDIYPKSNKTKKVIDTDTGEIKEVPQLGDPMPPSKAWKNPMAMRTMYELKKLINYLLEVGKIDVETKIVIEMARELNDSNLRKAIEYWQNDRNVENEEFKKEIIEILGKKELSDDDYNKFRAAVEQYILKLSEMDEKKYNEFIRLAFEKKNKKEDVQTQSTNKEESQKDEKDVVISNDYITYLLLYRKGFVKLLLDQPLGIGRILNPVKDFKNKLKSIKEMLDKYRLWKEQKFQCLYTGRFISFTELFDPTKCQIEHTIPRSISFDSEMKNITVCDAVYNSEVKSNKFPTECTNYEKTFRCRTAEGEKDCTPIKERVERIIKPKVDELKARIANLNEASKKIPSWDVDRKNANIRLSHYLKFELDYWQKKYQTFTVKPEDWKDQWKNSQLVDTQIITKYARAYLKSLFYHIDVQKATIVNEFKKIYQIQNDEQKDRSRHSHHAIDAAVLTLIPGSAKREEILKQYYQALEQKQKFHTKPYDTFDANHVLTIDENILIYHATRDKTLTPTRKKVRKRDKVLLTKTGKPMVMQGHSIRGQLHKETFLGAIKVVERNKEGFALKENGKYVIKKNKNGKEEIWKVARVQIKELKKEDFDDPKPGKEYIVDELLRKHIKKQLDNGTSLNDVVDFQGKKIRHIRYKNFVQKTFDVKQHIFLSKQKHKQFTYAQNTQDSGNYLYLLHEGEVEKKVKKEIRKEIIREAKIISLFDFCKLGFSSVKQIWNDNGLNITENNIPLKYIIKAGRKALFYDKSKEELKDLDRKALQNRLFKVYKFNEIGSPYIYLQNHIEARSEKELENLDKGKDGYTKFDPNIFQYRLKLKCDKLNCVFEGNEFKIKPDGTIVFNF
jgi:CRISPR-associated endonuclease Csn1